MHIFLNGKADEIEPNSSIMSLVKKGNWDPESIIVDHNGSILKMIFWENTIINADDAIEIFSFVDGG